MSAKLSSLQESDWVAWINDTLSAADGDDALAVRALAELADGLVLIRLLEVLAGASIDKFNAAPKNRLQMVDNVLVVFTFVEKEYGAPLHGITPYQVVDGNVQRTMGVLTHIVTHARRRRPELAAPRGAATDDGDGASPGRRRIGQIQSQFRAGFARRRDSVYERRASEQSVIAAAIRAGKTVRGDAQFDVEVPPEIVPAGKQKQLEAEREREREREREAHDAQQAAAAATAAAAADSAADAASDASGADASSSANAADVADVADAADATDAEDAKSAEDSAPAANAESDSKATAADVPSDANGSEAAAAAQADDAGADAPAAAAVAAPDAAPERSDKAGDSNDRLAQLAPKKTRTWKRHSESLTSSTLDTYADRYKQTGDDAAAQAAAEDEEALLPDAAEHYSDEARRILVSTREGASDGKAYEVPVWVEPDMSYDDLVRQLDARIREMQAPDAEPHRSNRVRPWTSPLVVYVSTKARGLLGCLADVGEELPPHAVASALEDEGEVALYEYRVLSDDTHEIKEPTAAELEEAAEAARNAPKRRKEKRRKKKKLAKSGNSPSRSSNSSESPTDAAQSPRKRKVKKKNLPRANSKLGTHSSATEAADEADEAASDAVSKDDGGASKDDGGASKDDGGASKDDGGASKDDGVASKDDDEKNGATSANDADDAADGHGGDAGDNESAAADASDGAAADDDGGGVSSTNSSPDAKKSAGGSAEKKKKKRSSMIVPSDSPKLSPWKLKKPTSAAPASPALGVMRRASASSLEAQKATSAAAALARAAADEQDEKDEEAALAAAAERRMRKRNELAKEILMSERKYVESGLDVLISEYLEPLRKHSYITKEQIKFIFGDVEAIRNYNRLLLDQLEARMKAWDEEQRMGDIFLGAIPFLKVYTMYVNKYNNALETLVECTAQKKKFASFLDKQMNSTRCGGLGIGSYLIMPIQRIPRYVMLLQELLRYTEPAHVDYDKLHEALKSMKELADYVNERKREAENLAQVNSVAKLLTGMSANEALSAPHRRFVEQAALGVAVTPDSYDSSVEPKPFFVILFNDMLVFAKTAAKIRKGKGVARSVQLTAEQQDEERQKEHKYVGRVLLQHYGLVDGQALTASGATAESDAGGGDDDGWDIFATSVSTKKLKKNEDMRDIASHCLRLEPLLPVHELPLAPDTAADGFSPRAFYRLYMSSEEEKQSWMRALDECLCALLESEVSRRLETSRVTRLASSPANAKAAYAAPEKKGTLYKRGKDGVWDERTFVLHGALLFYTKPKEKATLARSIDLRTAAVKLAPRDCEAGEERRFCLQLQTAERLYYLAPAEVAGAEVETFQWIFAIRGATTRHFLLVDEQQSDARQKGKRRSSDNDTIRRKDGVLRALDEILASPYNSRCHDCSSEATNWVSMTTGAVLCDACASVHVQLPAGVSSLQSISLSKWTEDSLIKFRQSNTAVLKRLQRAAQECGVSDGDGHGGSDGDGDGDGGPLSPRHDVFAVAANMALREVLDESKKFREVRRPSPNESFKARAMYIQRLYITLAGARKPLQMLPLDSMDGVLYRRPHTAAAWKREMFRLRGASLDYDKAKAIGTRTESILLRAAEVRPARTQDRPFAFDVVTPTRIYSLAAETQDEMSRWVLSILYAIQMDTERLREEKEAKSSVASPLRKRTS